jgi:16S rRNA (adenine1518-N6/adenine1519-N6)-dimethyltransferase
MLSQSQLKEIFSKHDFAPLKRLGENYLIDANIKDKIIAEAAPSGQDVILEIGSGLGALTIDLASSGARVIAVEKDRKAFAALKALVGDKFPNLTLLHQDILKFDLESIAAGKRLKIVGNLPYYITTPIIELLIENAKLISSILVMVQREFAARLMASPGTKAYSSLSCFVQYYIKPVYSFTVKRESFYPVPDVDSSLIRLEILDKPSVRVKDEALFFKVVRGSFNQRRKTILNSLSRELALNMPKDELSALLGRVGIAPSARPETLSLADFAKIANSVFAAT